MEARPPCRGTGLHLSQNFHFGLPSPIQYKPNRRRLILQAASFSPGAVGVPQGGGVTLCVDLSSKLGK